MFNYFGSKYKLAPTYQAPKHEVIVEPFAGSAQYACYWLAERPSLSAVIIDSDPLVISTWERMLESTPEEIMQWTMQLGQPIYDYIDMANYDPSHKVANERIVTRFYQSRPRWAAYRRAIGNRITVIEGDYTDAPDIEATWFVDPPYQHQGQTRYKHDSRTLDFKQLAEWCQSRRGQVIVCEAAPADWLPFQHHQTSANLSGTTPELVWYNQVDPTLLDLIQ